MSDATRLSVEVTRTLGEAFTLEVSFTSAARSLALFGPSGAGKSTLLECIAGVAHPSQGRIALGEQVVLDTAAGVRQPPRARRVGYVLQDALLFPLMTVRENLAFGQPETPRLTLDRVAGLFEVEHLLERRPRNLSGGERQRVALARAVLSEPAVLLCDEPFSALDAPRRDRLAGLLVRVRDELGIPLVLVTHRVREVLALAEEVVVLDAGRVAHQGTPAELQEVLLGEDEAPTNFWAGTVADDGHVTVGAASLTVSHPGLEPGHRVRLTIAPEHVALARQLAEGQSPRNHLAGRVTALVEVGVRVRVTLEVEGGVNVRALVTPAAVEELGLSVGTEAVALIKATALEVLAVEPGK